MSAPKSFTDWFAHDGAQVTYKQESFGKTLANRLLIIKLKSKKRVELDWSVAGKTFNLGWTAGIFDSKNKSIGGKCRELHHALHPESAELLAPELTVQEIAEVKQCIKLAIIKWPVIEREI